MKQFLLMLFFLTFAGFGAFFLLADNTEKISGAPPYGVADNPPTEEELDEYSYLKNWKRPDGPAKVALQVGHWKSNEAPEELKKLRANTGASGGGKSEWEVNYEIASLAAQALEERGIQVKLLPTTIPPDYWADVFIAVHADGNESYLKSGFKVASPRRDMTNNANSLRTYVEEAYQKATGLEIDPNITRNMTGYYAFGWWRYDHAVHPMTTSVILETGFLTSPADRTIIVDNPQLSADGLANGVINYLISQGLLEG